MTLNNILFDICEYEQLDEEASENIDDEGQEKTMTKNHK